MSSSVKACYFDIDGTLLGKSGEITTEVLDTIALVKESGIRIGIATGRPWFAAKHIAESIQTDAPCMTFSGALLTDRTAGKTLQSHTLIPEDIETLIKLSSENRWYLELYTETEYFVEARNHIAEIHATYMHSLPIERSLNELLTEPLLKAVIVFEGELPEGALELIKKETSQTEIAVAYGAAHPDIHFVNITNRSAERLNALRYICDSLSCTTDEIMAFGDGESDLPFLTSVRYGVAMGNAKSIVTNAAPYTTQSVENGGVAHFLRNHFKL